MGKTPAVAAATGTAGFCFVAAATLRACGPPKKQNDQAKFLDSITALAPANA
jgi:hypothetical protein